MIRVADLAVAADALAGRTILVTGAHGGLGEAAALACAAAGATVVLLGRRVPKLNRVYDAIVARGFATPAIYPLDLEGAGPADYEQMADAIERECGGLHGILHTAAEFTGLTQITSHSPEDWVRGIHVNLTAPILLTRACLPLMRQAEDAAVVFVLDDPQRIARAYWGPYAIAKHGLAGAVAVFGDELENTPVRVHGLMPGPMRTPLRARAWFAEDPGQWPPASEYAPACVWALAQGAAEWRGKVLPLAAGAG